MSAKFNGDIFLYFLIRISFRLRSSRQITISKEVLKDDHLEAKKGRRGGGGNKSKKRKETGSLLMQ